MLPAISDPIPKTEHRPLTSPPYPPELPPGDLSLFQGFNDLPQILLTDSEDMPNCGVLLLTNGIIPAFLNDFISADY